MAVTLLIADDHELIRAGLREFLRNSGIETVGEARTGLEAIGLAVQLKPDVVLLSPSLFPDEEEGVLEQLKRRAPSSVVLVFATHRSAGMVARAVAADAAGVLLKEVSRETIVEALRSVADGKTLWSRDELRRAGSGAGENASDVDVQLTRRESEVLVKLVDGLTNKQIAQELDISYETVKEHVQHILRKIGVTDRTQAAVWAVRQGLV